MSVYYTLGLVLCRQNYREVDRLVTIYSQEFGKIVALARGSKKISSKLAGSLEPFTLANFMLAQGKRYDIIAGVEVVGANRHLRASLLNLNLALYFCTVVDCSTTVHQRDRRVFDLLQEILSWLDTPSPKNISPQIIIWYFTWRYLSFLGYQPELFNCLNCGHKILPKKNYFSQKKGGLICNSCQAQAEDAAAISDNTIKILRLIIQAKKDQLLKLKINPAVTGELNKLTKEKQNFTLEKEVNWEKFIFN